MNLKNVKFRAWYKPDFETEDGAILFEESVDDCGLYFVSGDIVYPFRVPFIDDDWIVESSVGKKDLNDKDIFEGDIVEYTEKLFEHDNAQKLVGVIKYDDYFCAFGIAGTEDGDCMNYFTDMTIRDFKVIGNIYKNKELLKK